MSWLEALKPGAPVIYTYGMREEAIGTVDRLTATQIVVGKSRYRRRDGSLIGSHGWHYQRLIEPTPDRVHAVKVARARREMRNADWTKVPEDVVLRMYAELREATR